MVIEEFDNFWQSLPIGLLWFSGIVVTLAVVLIAIVYLIASIRSGPKEAAIILKRQIPKALPDVFLLSPRRVFAVARLAVQESIRRRVLLVAFALFALALLVGGWFLDVKSDHPDRVYINFVLWGTLLLIGIMVWLLSAFSLPTDIKNKTIYTVVTKPVRVGEIVLGRIVGFVAVGSVLLLLMSIISYFFVIRGLSHYHTLTAGDLDEVAATSSSGRTRQQPSGRKEGRTSLDSHHRHEVIVEADGTIYTEEAQGHTHTITPSGDSYDIGPQQGMLQARVPHYGTLKFIERTGGEEQKKGISTGSEWTYRSYIEGGTFAALVWSFEDVELEDFLGELTSEERQAVLTDEQERSQRQQELVLDANQRIYLPLELTLAVFRTHKGDIEKPVNGSIVLQHPTRQIKSVRRPFVSAEYSTKSLRIPRIVKASDEDNRLFDADIFKDLTEDGKLKIYIYCEDSGQYFGAAQADLYIRADDSRFFLNFFKGYISIWLQMVIVASLGVAFSTLLNVAVTLMATCAAIVMGFFSEFIGSVAHGAHGGGPIESLIRMVTQQNIMGDLDVGIATQPVKAVDWVLMKVMELFTHMLPNLREFDTSEFVIKGFNISGHTMAIDIATTLGIFLVLTVLGSFMLKTREIAA